jgi:hypothetical protein
LLSFLEISKSVVWEIWLLSPSVEFPKNFIFINIFCKCFVIFFEHHILQLIIIFSCLLCQHYIFKIYFILCMKVMFARGSNQNYRRSECLQNLLVAQTWQWQKILNIRSHRRKTYGQCSKIFWYFLEHFYHFLCKIQHRLWFTNLFQYLTFSCKNLNFIIIYANFVTLKFFVG